MSSTARSIYKKRPPYPLGFTSSHGYACECAHCHVKHKQKQMPRSVYKDPARPFWATGVEPSFCSRRCRVRHWRVADRKRRGVDSPAEACAVCGGGKRNGLEDLPCCSLHCLKQYHRETVPPARRLDNPQEFLTADYLASLAATPTNPAAPPPATPPQPRRKASVATRENRRKMRDQPLSAAKPLQNGASGGAGRRDLAAGKGKGRACFVRRCGGLPCYFGGEFEALGHCIRCGVEFSYDPMRRKFAARCVSCVGRAL